MCSSTSFQEVILFRNKLARNCFTFTCGFTFFWVTAATALCTEHFVIPDRDLKTVMKRVVAGDELILQDGTWGDADLTFEWLPGTAAAAAHIHIRAETPGQVIFTGKKSRGTAAVVWLSDQPGDHRIDHNHFGHRTELGQNGGDTIRPCTNTHPCAARWWRTVASSIAKYRWKSE